MPVSSARNVLLHWMQSRRGDDSSTMTAVLVERERERDSYSFEGEQKSEAGMSTTLVMREDVSA
jgi:hypothetical protein